ncbi:MAG: hypothetical protein AAGF44_03410 [Pseudomonadota bacterium]
MRSAALALVMLAACDSGAGLDRTDLRAEDVQAAMLNIFDEMCLDQMPAMAEVRTAMAEIAERDLRVTPSLDRDAYSVVASRRGGIILTRGTPAWPAFEGEHRCEVSAAAIPLAETTEAALALFAEDGRAAYTLAEARPDHVGERRAWAVAGAQPGMRFEVAAGASAEGGTRQTILRLVWRN